jgi:hypothetical protein
MSKKPTVRGKCRRHRPLFDCCRYSPSARPSYPLADGTSDAVAPSLGTQPSTTPFASASKPHRPTSLPATVRAYASQSTSSRPGSAARPRTSSMMKEDGWVACEESGVGEILVREDNACLLRLGSAGPRCRTQLLAEGHIEPSEPSIKASTIVNSSPRRLIQAAREILASTAL